MKRRSIQNYLVVVTSFFILTFPTYRLFSNFSQMNLFPADLNFENADQDYQLNDLKYESDTVLLDASIVNSPLEVSLFEQSYHLSSPVLPLDQKTCILRC